MNKIFYISDLHFGHDNIIKYDDRPFKNTKEMEEKIIENWNNTVDNKDTVYILGDVNWADASEHDRIISKLNGEKILVVGNHDKLYSKRNCSDNYYDYVTYYEEITDNKRRVILSHYPIISYNGMYHGYYHLYGHVHVTADNNMIENYKKAWEEYYCKPCKMANVGCMMPWMNYTPRTLDEIIQYMNW